MRRLLCQTGPAVHLRFQEFVIRAILILVGFTIVLRLAASALRLHFSLPRALAAWLMTGLAAWMAAASAGAWAPAWTGLAPALLGFLLSFRFPERIMLPIVEGSIVVLAGLWAVPSVAWPLLVAASAVLIVTGAAFDHFLSRDSHRVDLVLTAIFAGTVGAVAMMDGPRYFVDYALKSPRHVLNLALAPGGHSQPIDVAPGVVAWLDRPTGKSVGGALFFHGYHGRGARQPAALPIRRALQKAGYTVLALDSPGFGVSRPIKSTAPLEAWDPSPVELAAYDRLKAEVNGAPILLVGHSLGCTAVLRMLNTRRPVSGAVLMGAGWAQMTGTGRMEYWLDRFNRQHEQNPPLSMEKWREVEDTYSNRDALLFSLRAGRTKTLFIDFSRENADLEKTRDRYYDMLPEPKLRARLAASHYMDADFINAFIVGDPLPARALYGIIRRVFKPETTATTEGGS